MALKKLWAIPKDGYLLLLDYDDEDDDINFLEEAHSEENVSFSEEWQRFASSVETPIENRNLLSGEQQDGNASKLDLMEVQNPVTHDDENANPEEVVGDTRSPVQNILGKFEGDINKTLHIKRKRMETYIKDSFKDSNQKLEQLWKTNKQERKKINNKFCEQYITTFQKFDMDVQKFNEEQEKSVNNYQKEEQALKLSKCSQSQTLEAIKDMHEKYMEGLMNLETNNYNVLFDVDGELRKEMSVFKKDLMKHTLKYSSTFPSSD